MSKIFINEDVGYLLLEEALVHLADDWICGGNVSHETVMTMRDALRESIKKIEVLEEYKKLYNEVAELLNTANYKLAQISTLANRQAG